MSDSSPVPAPDPAAATGSDAAHLDAPGLREVIGDGPAAVLLVDLRTRQVVHASPVAEQLAPHTGLPIGLDAWSDAAMLRDRDGNELADTDHPLSRVARSEPVAGQAVSAARHSDLGSHREPLWVVAVPMTGAPALDRHCLVVLLPLRDLTRSESEPDRLFADTTLGERAVQATGLSFTVADARQEDQPLIWVNAAFTATTGYELADAIGHNCRFLQGPATSDETVASIRAALDTGQAVTETLLNYRKDGTPFWNQVDISPVHGAGGEITHFVGIQADVSGRVDADRARDRALEAERVARTTAEKAQRDLRFLFDSVDHLAGSLDAREVRRRLFDLVLPHLADWAMVVHRDAGGDISVSDGAHTGPHHATLETDLARILDTGLRGGLLAELVNGDARVRHLDEIAAAAPARPDGPSPTVATSALFVSLPGRRGVEDLLVLARGPARGPFSPDDAALTEDLGQRVGLILDNARLFEVQADIANTLQQSLLPALPAVPGLAASARYLAGQLEAEVGGDFYELLDLGEDGVAFAIGDTAGHDIRAAAAMGHLQGLLRASILQHPDRPSLVLETVDAMLARLGMETIATAACGHLTPDQETWTLRWAYAGHPPLLVRHPDGTTEVLEEGDEAFGPMLGVHSHQARHDTTRQLAPGTTLLAYTDGLVERRGEHLDTGLARLEAALREAPEDRVCDHVLVSLAGAHDDDVAVLALTLGDPLDARPTGQAAGPSA